MRLPPFLLTLPLLASTATAQEPGRGSVSVTRDGGQSGYSLRAVDATFEEIGKAVAAATRCGVEIEKPLRQTRLTLHLSPRTADRLCYTLARRTGARMEVGYRMEPFPPGAVRRKGALSFADEPVSLQIDRPVPLTEALRELPVNVEVDPAVTGRVRVLSIRHPLAYVLDQIADQVDARWAVVVRYSERKAVDAEADELERRQQHFSDLAALTSEERREEINAELDRIERLPAPQQRGAVERLREDILGLAPLLKSVPGEHRAGIGPQVISVARDYAAVVGRLPRDRRALFDPCARALAELERALWEIR